MKTKRWLALCLAATLAAFPLVGCGEKPVAVLDHSQTQQPNQNETPNGSGGGGDIDASGGSGSSSSGSSSSGGTGTGGRDVYMSGTPGKGTDPNKLTVYIFSNDSDAMKAKQLCKNWAENYNKAHGTDYTVELSNSTDKGQYLDDMTSGRLKGNMADVFYIEPKLVRSYAEAGALLNIADYLDTVTADPALQGASVKQANKDMFGQLLRDPLSLYSYQRRKGLAGQTAYVLGQPVTYNAEKNGLYTDASGGREEVGLYGLPVDYASFSPSYNNLFFSDAMKKAITTTKPTEERNVGGAENETNGSVSNQRNYTMASGEKEEGGDAIIQYAVSGTYTNPYTGDTIKVEEGKEANIINIGVPTRYFPFNFYRYDTYTEALQGGDPLALLCEAYTDGEGYVVTIPGFPNDTFRITGGSRGSDVPYDTSMGHITYTYAEYSALIWAMTYYLNTFDGQPFPGGGGLEGETPDGKGGTSISGKAMIVFGGEQYEGSSGGAIGSTLYLLPWLYGNDADLIDATNTLCAAMDGEDPVGEGAKIENAADWRNVVGDKSDKVQKMNLDGTMREVDVQYGFNSQRFIETYGAFLALASDWNANNGGDSDAQGDNNGWDYFRAGRSLFCGAGSWDGETFNDYVHPDRLAFRFMPTPISENYALYSKIKGANYTMETYSSAGTGDGKAQRQNLESGRRIYSAEQIAANQILRQDKWGARMDSVGYAVNGQVTNYTGEHEWKREAAVSLAMALSVGRETQITRTYAGVGFPIYLDQMEQFVNYQNYGTDGAFRDMLTPEGFSDMNYYRADGNVNEDVAADAKKIWDGYYQLAMEMEEAVRAKNRSTVGEFLEGKTVASQPVKYDRAYENTPLTDFTGSFSRSFLAYAMKVLRMVPLTRESRELRLRMEYGLNAVRDSTMYTYTDYWLFPVDARGSLSTMFAYTRGMTVKVGGNAINGTTTDGLTNFRNGVKQDPTRTDYSWETPVLYCLRMTRRCQEYLSEDVSREQLLLDRLLSR